MRTSLLVAASLAFLSAFTGSCRSTAVGAPHDPRVVHSVYLTLKDDSPQARQELIASCYGYLLPIEGVDFLAAGQRDESLTRDANDQDFDVALTIVFRNRAALDAYLPDARHQALLATHRDNLEHIRVFDSLEGPVTLP